MGSRTAKHIILGHYGYVPSLDGEFLSTVHQCEIFHLASHINTIIHTHTHTKWKLFSQRVAYHF